MTVTNKVCTLPHQRKPAPSHYQDLRFPKAYRKSRGLTMTYLSNSITTSSIQSWDGHRRRKVNFRKQLQQTQWSRWYVCRYTNQQSKAGQRANPGRNAPRETIPEQSKTTTTWKKACNRPSRSYHVSPMAWKPKLYIKAGKHTKDTNS